MILKRDHGEVYYEVYGEGEPLLLIHGVIVDAAFYEKTAKILAQHYKVICYDRRGYSRSKSESLTEYHMEEQAGDILALLSELGIERVKIASASAGAVIGQYFLCNYPDRVEHLIMHEPAMLGHMLEEDEEFAKWAQDMGKLIENKKYNTALLKFSGHIGAPDPRSPKKAEEVCLREMNNIEYAFTIEIPGILKYQPEIEKIRQVSDKVTITAGEKSGETVYVQEAVRLAEKIGKKVLYVPGGHNLPYDLPMEYAICLIGTFCIFK